MSNNPMACDITTGVCGDAGDDVLEIIDLNPPQKTVKLYYVTDPICSHCWALEPVMRRFEAEYGQYFKFQTVVGGLLKGWDGFADVKNGIGKPADVAGHWREVGEHSRMPIDGSLWLDNYIQSSYPPSRVFKIIQQKDAQLGHVFLRRAREAVFVFNRNIGDESEMIDIVNHMGLNGEAIVSEAGTDTGLELMEQDFALAASLGVRGFPTIVMVNEDNKGVKIVGPRSIDTYIQALEQALGAQGLQAKPVPSLTQLLDKEVLLFSKEIEVMYDLEPSDVNAFLQQELSADAFSLKEILGEKYIELVR
ncbi:DsbA family oxidoreductase [Cohnella abietis]|nr:DsbA family protein [Cohnella abietis]